MSELEKKNVNEMDAAEMLERHQRLEHGERHGVLTEHEVIEAFREFEAGAKRWSRRQGWTAIGLCLLSAVTVVACCAALAFGYEKLILIGIGAANLMMAGAWWQKAKEDWAV